MSRTIRRKNAHQRWLYVDKLEDINEWEIEHFRARSLLHCQARQSARFHSDNRTGEWGVPRWYRQERNKRFKRENDHELHRCREKGEWDDHLPHPYLRDAGYFWW